jgi:hypothetical protein
MQLLQRLAANSLRTMGKETGSDGRDFFVDDREPRRDFFTRSFARDDTAVIPYDVTPYEGDSKRAETRSGWNGCARAPDRFPEIPVILNYQGICGFRL